GPPERWIFIGDSAGSTAYVDREAFDAFSRALSSVGPVIDTMMGDSHVIDFYLYRDGQLLDKFSIGTFPSFRFTSDKEAATHRGQPNLWVEFLSDRESLVALRSAWTQGRDANEILSSTSQHFGWNSELSVGYTFDYEGIPEKYSDHLHYAKVDLKQ